MKLCTLASGSSGNSVFLEHGNTRVLIDSGRSGKYIENALEAIGEKADAINAILVTHEHIDHIRSVGTLARRHNVPIFATRGTWEAIMRDNRISRIDEKHIKKFDLGEEFSIGDLGVHPFAIPHDAACPVGYRFIMGSEMAIVATDIGHFSEEVEDNVLLAKYAVLEANHDERMLENGDYPIHLKKRILSDRGHLCNRLSSEIAVKMVESGTEHIIFSHLSSDNNSPYLVQKEATSAFARHSIKENEDVRIIVAPRENISEMIVA